MLANAPDSLPLEERKSTSTRDPFAVVECPALRTALREVSAEWGPRLTPAPGGGDALDRTLVRLALSLDGASGDPVLREEGAGGAAGNARSEERLLGAIRADLLEQWRRGDLPTDEDRLLHLLHAIGTHIESLHVGEDEDFEVRLAEPDAFGLVTEVAHDLRSPLTSILFLSEAMRNGHSGVLSELQQRQLGLVYSAALGLMGVVNDLMTVARERTSDPLEEPLPFSVPQTFEAVREMVGPMAEAKQIELRFEVRCYGQRIGQSGPLGRVLLNLVTNAIKFTPEGGTVEVLADSISRDMVEISVRDTGRGLPREHQERMFQPFRKSRGRQGFFFAASGLGLTIVRRLLEKMDAELKIESEVGQGTRFAFVLSLPTPQ